MSARIPPGFAEAWYRFTVVGDSEPMFCSLGVNLAVGITPDTTTANNILGAGAANLRALLSSATTWDGGHVIFGADGGDNRVDSTLAPVTGTSGATPLPPNCAMLIRKMTVLGGRRNRGRLFVPGISNTGVSNAGVIAPATLSAYQTSATAWMAALVATAEVVDLSLFHDTAPFTPTNITALVCQGRLATQRRRLRP